MSNPIEPRRPVPPAPVHPLAALTTIVLDNVFGAVELVNPLAILLTSVTVGTVGTLATMFIQRFMAKDSWGVSIAKGLVMGVIAGVPYQVTGTAVGVPLLAWAGLHQWIRLPAPKDQPAAGDEGEIVDAEIKDVSKDPDR